MRSRILVATTTAAALAGGSAFAQCGERLMNLETQYGDFVAGNVDFEQSRPVLRDLRDAAVRLQRQGLEQACESVVDAMALTLSEYGRYAQGPTASRSANAGDTGAVNTDGATVAPSAGGVTTVETAPAATVGTSIAGTTEVMTSGMTGRPVVTPGLIPPEQVAARAVPLSQSELSLNTAAMQDRDIYNYAGEDVGDFEGVLISRSQPTHIVVNPGRFFSMDDDAVAIPVDLVNWDPEWRTIIVPFTEEQLEGAPQYAGEQGWDAGANDRYWGQLRG